MLTLTLLSELCQVLLSSSPAAVNALVVLGPSHSGDGRALDKDDEGRQSHVWWSSMLGQGKARRHALNIQAHASLSRAK
jgi:hypothetical protein